MRLFIVYCALALAFVFIPPAANAAEVTRDDVVTGWNQVLDDITGLDALWAYIPTDSFNWLDNEIGAVFYYGSNFEDDSDAFMQLIQYEIIAADWPDNVGDDLMYAVTDPACWN